MEHSSLQQAETHSLPMLIPGAVLDWPALERWTEQSGVLHMTELAGNAQIQVMNSTEAEALFFGDMRQYTPHTCSFGDYLSACDPSNPSSTGASVSAGRAPGQAYLAQASLDQGQPLAALRQDFDIPEAIKHAEVNHTNLWMSIRGSRSSLHYDPYHNLLCLVQGKKTVKLMSPEVTHQLYPMSILGESPNHSHVNFAHPDFEQHPLYKQALASQQVFALQAGDALFIPEGWWHQVDSEQTTIAVNFWWQSAFTKSLRQQPHMQQYYLRRLMDGLLDIERCNALASVQPHPAIQAFQAAVDTVATWHSSDPASDMTTSDSSDTSSAMTGTSSPAAAATASAVAAAAKPAEQVAQSVSAAAAPSQPQGNSHGQSESSQHVPPATPQARQSAGTVLDSLESCKPGRKRKAADMFDGCRPDDAAGMHPATVQMTQPCQGQTLASSPEAERLSAACHRAQLVESGGPEHVIAPTVGGRSAAGNSVQQDVEASRAEAADCAGQQEPLHIACMQILAGAVADCLDRPSGQDASTGLEDPITRVLASLQPEDLQAVLAMMSRCVPRTLEALLLQALLPAAAELLTQKLEQADAETGSMDRQTFYSDLYGVVSDPQTALHALLDKKELFSQQLCQGLLSRLLGL